MFLVVPIKTKKIVNGSIKIIMHLTYCRVAMVNNNNSSNAKFIVPLNFHSYDEIANKEKLWQFRRETGISV